MHSFQYLSDHRNYFLMNLYEYNVQQQIMPSDKGILFQLRAPAVFSLSLNNLWPNQKSTNAFCIYCFYTREINRLGKWKSILVFDLFDSLHNMFLNINQSVCTS